MKYKGVYKRMVFGRAKWIARHQQGGEVWEKVFDTEKEAAKQYDFRLIRLGKQPVNILRKL